MTNQQLKAHCEDVIANPRDHSEMVLAMAKALLPCLEADTVAYIHPKMLDAMSGDDGRSCGRVWKSSIDEVSGEKRIPLYTEPPVPEIKLPERAEFVEGSVITDFSELANEVWNDCIDEVKRLNGVTS